MTPKIVYTAERGNETSMAHDMSASVTLANGVQMPVLGFGTYLITGGDAYRCVREALDAGYRSIDTASMYENEAEVGRALRDSGVDRADVFVATKVWNDEQGEDGVVAAIDRSLSRLALEYVDLYLVHWPRPDSYASTWRGMERVLSAGKARAIGVSNFLAGHLSALLAVADVKPMVDQIEHHPYLQQTGLRELLRSLGVVLEAWAPLGRGNVLDDATVREIAASHGATVAQVVLRWSIQHGNVVIPKSVTAERIRENAAVFGFSLTSAEMAAIDALDKGEAGRFGKHPEEISCKYV